MTRALRFSAASKTPIYYSDIGMNLDLNPITEQLQVYTNENAVATSMRNLLLTQYGERFYHPEIGSKLYAGLFEMDDVEAKDFITRTISETLRQNEPRILAQSIQCTTSPTDGGLYVTVAFSMINIPNVFQTSFFVKRNR